MSSKKFCNAILKNDNIDIDRWLAEDFDETVSGLFEALYSLLSDYSRNKNKIDYLLSSLEKNVLGKNDSELALLTLCCLEFKDKTKEFSNKVQRQVVHTCSRIDLLEKNITEGNSDNSKIESLKVLEYLIFESKNLNRIKIFLEYSDVFVKSTKYLNEVITKTLKKLVSLDSKNIETTYYYDVVMILISRMNEKALSKKRNDYFDILNSSLNRKQKYIKNIIAVLKGEYSFDSTKLENYYNISLEYPSVLGMESYKLSSIKNARNDYMEQKIITIDSTNTARVDDALCLERNSDGSFTLYIHITDIPSFIPQDSVISHEAKHRIENIYLGDKTIPIYPDNIACNICSLLEHNKRNVITYAVDIDPDMNILVDSFRIEPGKIVVKKKLNYTDTAFRLKSNSTNNYDEMLKYLLLLSLKIEKNIKIDSDYLISDLKRYHEFIKVEFKNNSQNTAQFLVQSLMKTVNYLIGNYFNQLELPHIYKNAIIDSNGQKAMENIIQQNPSIMKNTELYMRLIKSYKTTITGINPESFNGYDVYSSSTDPLWKYVDTYNQYLTYRYIFQEQENTEIGFYLADQLARYANERREKNKEFASLYSTGNALTRKKIR